MNYGKRRILSVGPSSPGLSSYGDPDDFPEEGEKDTRKRKSRNQSEKRRRDQFNMLVNELCGMVTTNSRKMDKTTVLKATIGFLRKHNEVLLKCRAHEIKEDWKPSFLSNDEFAQIMLEGLDAFLLVITQSGKILYASDSVTPLINHLPTDLVNSSFYTLAHPNDQTKITNLISSHDFVSSRDRPDYEMDANQLAFTCHLRCSTSSLEGDPPVYEKVQCQGNFWRWIPDILSDDDESDDALPEKPQVCFCCTVQVKGPRLVREVTFSEEGKKEFTSRHSMEWKFLFLDHRAPPIIGYLPFELLGTSGYDYFHPDDLEQVAKCHEQLVSTGKGTSCYYRFLTKGQQWIWLQTTFYITYHQWNSKPEFIVCTNVVVNYADIYSELRQEQQSRQKTVVTMADPVGHDHEHGSTTNGTTFWTPSQLPPPPPVQPLSPTSKTSTGVTSESDMADSANEPSMSNLVLQVSMAIHAPTQSVLSAPAKTLSECLGNASGVQQPEKNLVRSKKPNIDTGQVASQCIAGVPVPSVEVQRRLQEQLCLKHCQLQEAIMRQQEELDHISEQLLVLSQIKFATQSAESDSESCSSVSVTRPSQAERPTTVAPCYSASSQSTVTHTLTESKSQLKKESSPEEQATHEGSNQPPPDEKEPQQMGPPKQQQHVSPGQQKQVASSGQQQQQQQDRLTLIPQLQLLSSGKQPIMSAGQQAQQIISSEKERVLLTSGQQQLLSPLLQQQLLSPMPQQQQQQFISPEDQQLMSPPGQQQQLSSMVQKQPPVVVPISQASRHLACMTQQLVSTLQQQRLPQSVVSSMLAQLSAQQMPSSLLQQASVPTSHHLSSQSAAGQPALSSFLNSANLGLFHSSTSSPQLLTSPNATVINPDMFLNQIQTSKPL